MHERFIRDPSIDNSVDVAPPSFYKSQREIYQSVRNFPKIASSLHYTFMVPDNPLQQMQGPFQTEPETEVDQHTVMSLSDIELAITPPSHVRTTISEAEVISAVNGIVGHTITVLMTEAVNAAREGNPINLVKHQTGIDLHEKELIDTICKTVQMTAPVKKPSDITPFVWQVWQQMRTQYTFFKMIPNSTKKPRIEGTQYSADFVRDYWESDQMNQFEEQLFFMHRARINNYLNSGNPFSDTPPLTIESNPEYGLSIEELVICHKHFGAYKIQFKGQADFVTSQRNKETGEKVLVIVDQKYGKGTKLHELPNRLQALLYSDALKEKQFSKKNYGEVTPRGVMFLYHVFDTTKDESFYIDASVYPDEYQKLMDALYETTSNWWMYQKEYKAAKFERQHAAVMPYIPKPNEDIRPVQFSLF